jgi:cold shock CspA family protein
MIAVETRPATRTRRVPRIERLSGKLVRIKEGSGYGFIQPDEGGPDYFVNIGQMRDRRDFVEGRRVTFRVGKPRAKEEAQGRRSRALPAMDVAGVGARPSVEEVEVEP